MRPERSHLMNKKGLKSILLKLYCILFLIKHSAYIGCDELGSSAKGNIMCGLLSIFSFYSTASYQRRQRKKLNIPIQIFMYVIFTVNGKFGFNNYLYSFLIKIKPSDSTSMVNQTGHIPSKHVQLGHVSLEWSLTGQVVSYYRLPGQIP